MTSAQRRPSWRWSPLRRVAGASCFMNRYCHSHEIRNPLRISCENSAKVFRNRPPHRPLAPPRAESRGQVDSGSGLAAVA